MTLECFICSGNCCCFPFNIFPQLCFRLHMKWHIFPWQYEIQALDVFAVRLRPHVCPVSCESCVEQQSVICLILTHTWIIQNVFLFCRCTNFIWQLIWSKTVCTTIKQFLFFFFFSMGCSLFKGNMKCMHLCVCPYTVNIKYQQKMLGDWQSSFISSGARLHALLHQVTAAVRLRSIWNPLTLGVIIYQPSETPNEGHISTNAASMLRTPYLSVSLMFVPHLSSKGVWY